jgi:ABC-type multidrug transport system fused ATPase/permease subunit
LSLILRLYEPSSGKIYLDGAEISKISLASLRQGITVAMQEPWLFNISIRENICYGLGRTPRRELGEIIELVQLGDFIRQLPKGLDTEVGEFAALLSQGLKQRVALARAIIRDSAVLIIDEATSSLDSEAEAKIMRQLRRRRQGRTTIVISHRLFSIYDAEWIYFLKSDGLLQQGVHEQLLREDNDYKSFFHGQLQLKQQPFQPGYLLVP